MPFLSRVIHCSVDDEFINFLCVQQYIRALEELIDAGEVHIREYL
jgi:hypothetical protein